MHFKIPTLSKTQRGFSLVEVIVAASLLVIIFGGLFLGFKYMIELVSTTKVQSGALAVATDEMEYLRSLSYNELGTVGGVPAGNIPQNSTTTLNGIVYTQEILIQYVDDPADGLEGADENSITTDYKQVRVKVSWDIKGVPGFISLVSNIIPAGMETTVGGGTIKVNVFDSKVSPLSGIPVRFVNNTSSTTIDTVRYTNSSGVAYLSGAPAAADYQIFVSDTGYSTDSTYLATTANPNPNTPPVAVLENQVSTMNFQIDKLSDLTITTVAPSTDETFSDNFADVSKLSSLSNTVVSSGSLMLAGGPGAYAVNGLAVSNPVAPGTIKEWQAVEFSATTSSATRIKIYIMSDHGAGLTLVPDTDLPGNSSGFSNSPIDLSSLSVTSYPNLSLQAELSSSDVNDTPSINDWSLSYIKSQSPIAGVSVSVLGNKTIGTNEGVPVLKHEYSGSTNASGQINLSDIEYDRYAIVINGSSYDVSEACPLVPYSLSPDTTGSIKMTLVPKQNNSLRVSVVDSAGQPIPNADVHLKNTGIDELESSSLCGQVYFGNSLYESSDYTLSVGANGYLSENLIGLSISSSSNISVILSQ